jgi:hypothetical protein
MVGLIRVQVHYGTAKVFNEGFYSHLETNLLFIHINLFKSEFGREKSVARDFPYYGS